MVSFVPQAEVPRDPRLWQGEEPYRLLGLNTNSYLNVPWVQFGLRTKGDTADPLNCPKEFFANVNRGILGLDYNLPSNVHNLPDPQSFLVKVEKTPKNIQAAVFDGVSWPRDLQSGAPIPSSSSSAAQAAAGHSSSFAPSLRSSSSSSVAAQAAAPSDSDASSFHPSDDSGSDSSDDFDSDPSDDSDSHDEDDRLEAPPHSSSSSDDPFTAITKKLADELWSRIPCLNPGTKQCRSRTDKLPMDGAAFSRAPPVLIRFFVLCSHTRGQMF